MPNTSTQVFSTSKAYDRVLRETLWVLRKEDVNGRLLLAVKSFSCSDVCACVGRVKSQPFTVGGQLRQQCVLSPLLFIVCMDKE